MRLPPLVAFALVLALAACAAPDGGASAQADDADADVLTVTVSDFMIEPSELSVTGFCSLGGHESLGMSGTLTVGG